VVSFATAGLAWFIVAAASVEAGAGPPPPRVDGKPVQVSFAFTVLDFARITAREESFDLTGYLELSWRDPRLAARARPADPDAGQPDPRRIWKPRVYFENALEQPRFHGEPVVEFDDDGMVTSWVILSGKFSTEMDLRDFPFDRQALEVRIGNYEDDSLVRFALRDSFARVGPDAFVSDWTIGASTARTDAVSYGTDSDRYARYVYRVVVARRSTFYVWRVMAPLSILAVVTWAVFWFDPVGLQPQISTCMAVLISLVAFHLSNDFAQPRVAYLTLIDRHALIGFSFVCGAVGVVAIIHVAVIRDRLDLARTYQRMARWAYLPAYVLAILLDLSTLAR
jgi:hypothetical protein